MNVKEINQNFVVLEYRQDKEDKDYGSCLWARFHFNLDSYELFITSDCGEYSYGWAPTPKSESFLELMARIGKDYLLRKLCGEPKEFDYEATKARFYDYFGYDEEDKEKLDEIFEEIEGDFEPKSGETFLCMFDGYNVDDHHSSYFCDAWEALVYDYTPQQKRICKIFHDCIQPKIREMIHEHVPDMNDGKIGG